MTTPTEWNGYTATVFRQEQIEAERARLQAVQVQNHAATLAQGERLHTEAVALVTLASAAGDNRQHAQLLGAIAAFDAAKLAPEPDRPASVAAAVQSLTSATKEASEYQHEWSFMADQRRQADARAAQQDHADARERLLAELRNPLVQAGQLIEHDTTPLAHALRLVIGELQARG